MTTIKNTVKIKLTLNEVGLSMFNKVPTFRNLLHPQQLQCLKLGENILTVNHYVWGTIQRVVNYGCDNMMVDKYI